MNEAVKEKRRTGLIVALIVVIVLAILTFGYVQVANYYKTHFPRNTYVNGVDVSGMTAENVKKTLDNSVQKYILTIEERDGVTETLTAADVGMTYQDNGEVDALLAEYNPYLWPGDFFGTDEHTIESAVQFDEALAKACIENLSCFNPALVKKPQNARLAFENGSCSIQAEVQGNQLDEDQAAALILDALSSAAPTVSFDEAGCYLAPEITSDDALLQEQLGQVSVYLGAVITFDFEDDRVYTVDGTVIQDWLTVDESGVYDLDNDAVYEWVKTQLAYKTDTFGLTHTFNTSKGTTVTLKGGDYGWCIARQDTTDKLIEAVKNGEVTEMEPEYQYKAKARGINDIGGTYVEVSIQDQHVWCYKDGVLVVEADCVTGRVSRGDDTPSGSVWAIDAKKSPAVLGTLDTMGYSSPVNYWMPFNGNIGLHDADGWRKKYGGDIYKTNGSHGCINLPYSAAKAIYEAVEIGTAVIVY